MRPSAPPLDPAFHKGDSRRSVQSEQPEQNRRSAVQPRPAIPPPPAVPYELRNHVYFGPSEYGWPDTIPAPPSSEAIVPAEPSAGSVGVISLELHERRVTELQQAGNRNLQEARDERSAHARTRFLLDCAVTQALVWKAQAHRLDSVWRTT